MSLNNRYYVRNFDTESSLLKYVIFLCVFVLRNLNMHNKTKRKHTIEKPRLMMFLPKTSNRKR